MEPKKNPEYDLDKKKGMFWLVGFVVALSVMLIAFEWKQYDKSLMDLGSLQIELEEEEMIPITQQEQPPPPPPPPPQTTIIEIVEDDEELEEELEIEDTDVDEDEVIEFVEVAEEEEVAEAEIFTIVENMPEFPGGEAKLFEYLGKSIKYPSMAKDAGIQGIVYVSFVIERDGSVADVQVLRGIGGGCDEEAVRVVEKMPNWSPGKQRGKPVRVRYNLPIRFVLK
jgi:protein TonB